ncbi:hypothetical protein L915_13057 [Phytophthora nicotianae]|uniref:Uncharacterized protein n=2 Tax=Phytophthora nicotianae TaxID=4792 RepID=W2GEI6_PHYNI|nr:hypothetical protein L915_13057 [Phytophthora nicotianae]
MAGAPSEWRVPRTKQGKHRLREARDVRLEWTKAYNCGGDWAHRVENQVQELLVVGLHAQRRVAICKRKKHSNTIYFYIRDVKHAKVEK